MSISTIDSEPLFAQNMNVPTLLSKKIIREEKKFIDKSVLFAAIIYPFTTIPQILEIFKDKKTAGISVLTWALYLLFSLFFLLYSIRRKLKPLIIEYILWVIMEITVIAGVFMYN